MPRGHGAQWPGIAPFFDVLCAVRERFPLIRFHIFTSGTDMADERLDRGLLDFAIIVQSVDLTRYNHLELPSRNRWGLIVPADDPLARRGLITREELVGLPLICSKQGLEEETLRWLGELQDSLDVVATYDMLYNAALMTREGIGYALGFEGIVDTGEASGLAFVPVAPELSSPIHLIWRRYQEFSPAAKAVLSAAEQAFGDTKRF